MRPSTIPKKIIDRVKALGAELDDVKFTDNQNDIESAVMAEEDGWRVGMRDFERRLNNNAVYKTVVIVTPPN